MNPQEDKPTPSTENTQAQNLASLDSEPVIAQEPTQVTESTQQAQTSGFKQNAQEHKSSKKLFIVLVLATVLLFGASGYLIWQTLQATTQGTVQTGGDQPNLEGKSQTTTE